MNLPNWVQEILDRYDASIEPLRETEISQALNVARRAQGDLGEDDWNAFLAESWGFFFHERPNEDSVWGTYFAPMVDAIGSDGTLQRSPDIAMLNAETVAHWEQRADVVHNPVMQARYADLAWDLAKPISNAKPNHQFARLATDAYLDAVERGFYVMAIDGVQWLGRALHLARSVKDKERSKRVVDVFLAFYDKTLSPEHMGVWISPFDHLYGQKGLLTEDQENRIISDLEAMLDRTSTVGEPNYFDPFGAQAAAERLAEHYRKRNDRANLTRVITTYASAFKKMSVDASPMLAMAWLQPVIERLEQEGLTEEAERMQVISAQKGQHIENDLKHYSVEVPISRDDFEKLAEQLTISNDLSATLHAIASYFLPKTEAAKNLVQELKTVAPLMSLIPITIVDSAGRPKAKVGPVDDAGDGRLYHQLAQTISFYQPFLSYVLDKVAKTFQPSIDDYVSTLYASPVFLENRRPLLNEGLEAYNKGDFVKAIHVLVPQIEEALRTLLTLIGIPAYKNVSRHPGVTDAKGMNDILSDNRVQDVLTEDLWRYLTVLYIDRRGLNLRNDLAHGLIAVDAFNQSTADRVFHSLLTLSLIRREKSPVVGEVQRNNPI